MREATIGRSYTFEACHHLPCLPDGHWCKRQHGHSYEVEVIIKGERDERGLVRGIMFETIDDHMANWLKFVDHYDLNEVGKMIKALELPTVENIAAWFEDVMSASMNVPLTVRVYEGPRSWAEVSSE
jgi:6-pyruvoyltetrahydropterin/6-carboxytetrahydropterin synthase